MILNEQQKLIKQRGQMAQEFLESEFCQQYLLPFLYEQKNLEYPEPKTPGWEDAYRLAYAKDSVYTGILQSIKNWVEEAKQLSKYEQSEVDIITA